MMTAEYLRFFDEEDIEIIKYLQSKDFVHRTNALINLLASFVIDMQALRSDVDYLERNIHQPRVS